MVISGGSVWVALVCKVGGYFAEAIAVQLVVSV